MVWWSRAVRDCDEMWQRLSTGKIEAWYDRIAAAKLIKPWLSRTIHLTGSQSAVVAYRITARSQMSRWDFHFILKKHERGVGSVSTCVVPIYAACQNVHMYACAHEHQCINVQVENNWDLDHWVGEWGRLCLCAHVQYVRISLKEGKSAKVCMLVSAHVSPLMNVFTEHPGLWLILNIDWSHNALWAGLMSNCDNLN